jgi:transposase-like protein
MTNEQMNALTKAIITGFTILAKAHMNAINASHPRQGAFLNTINEDPNCCALPIEPPAPVEAVAEEEEEPTIPSQSDPEPDEPTSEQFVLRFPTKRLTFSKTFKVELCQKIVSGKIPTPTVAARIFNIDGNLVSKWVRKYRKLGKRAFSQENPTVAAKSSEDLLQWVEKHGGQMRVANGQVIFNREDDGGA